MNGLEQSFKKISSKKICHSVYSSYITMVFRNMFSLTVFFIHIRRHNRLNAYIHSIHFLHKQF